MAGRAPLVRAEPGFTLPFFERLAPPPPPALVGARIETLAKPGDVVLDLAGRGGWVARAAVDRQRRAASLESTPLPPPPAGPLPPPPDPPPPHAPLPGRGASPRGPAPGGRSPPPRRPSAPSTRPSRRWVHRPAARPA